MIRPATRTKPLITVYSPAFNEEANVQRCYEEVRKALEPILDRYNYEHLFADNCSTDRTLPILREIAAHDRRVRVLSYAKNFGAEKSGMTMLRHSRGDAVICVVSDLQDPPSMIPTFVDAWEHGYEIVWGVYENAGEGWLMRRARHLYYSLLSKLSEEHIPKDHSGFGLYSQRVIREIIALDDHSPYIRGMIASVGYPSIEVPYRRSGREKGTSKHRWGFLLGFGMNAIISHSLVPLRLATFLGGALAGLAILLAFLYAWIKIFNWGFQAPGATTTIVILLFFSGVQLFFMGLIGEYVGAIHAQVRRKPFVVIREKINFDDDTQ